MVEVDEVANATAIAHETALEAARAHHRTGHLEGLVEAERICHGLLRTQPNDPETLCLLGRVAHDLGRYKIAAVILSKACALRPDDAAIHSALAASLRGIGQYGAAVRGYRRALELEPNLAKAHTGLGMALMDLDEHDQAIESFCQALALNPDSPRAHYGLAVALLHQAQPEPSVASFRRAVELAPHFSDAHAGVLFASHYLPVTREALFAEAVDWAERHANPLMRAATPHTNEPLPERPLRIGYVSGDFHSHPVGRFLETALTAHDRSSVELFCYSNALRVDETSHRLKAAADHWRMIWGMMDQAAADLVRQDQIDVLVDLSGHTSGNRLLLFARKPAPVQVSWLGYFDTTGMSAMDYVIADAHVCPPDAEAYFVEKVYRLPGDYLCFTPPRSRVEVDPPPLTANGYVTFGCFNNLTKVTPAVIAVWAQILHAVPGSRLRLKWGALKSAELRERYAAHFSAHGVAPDRLEMESQSSHADYLKSYGGVDIALDPFPYNGGTTTVEALWMGVPVISLAGDRFVSRMGLTHLSAVGLADLVARSEGEYVSLAISLAHDAARLQTLRRNLRHRLESSALCDAPRFTASLEHAFRTMWRAWCATQREPGAR